MTIRRATPADAERLAVLNRDFNGVQRALDEVQYALRNSSLETVLVAEDGGVTVGFLCLQTLHSVCYDKPWVEITEPYVAPAHRRRGAGASLLSEAQVIAERAGASEVLLRSNGENVSVRALCMGIGLEPASHVVFRRSYGRAV